MNCCSGQTDTGIGRIQELDIDNSEGKDCQDCHAECTNLDPCKFGNWSNVTDKTSGRCLLWWENTSKPVPMTVFEEYTPRC